MKKFIYKSSKEELIVKAQKYGIDTEGTLDDLRRRLSRFVDKNIEAFQNKEKTSTDTEETKEASGTKINPLAQKAQEKEVQKNERTQTEDKKLLPPTMEEDQTEQLERIRKWQCVFEGRDPVTFIEQLEEMKEMYNMSEAIMLKSLPQLFKREPLAWYHNNKEAWNTWDSFMQDFKEDYFPPNYKQTLKKEMAERKQRPKESFHKYATEMQTKMRRIGGMTEEDKVATLYDNMLAEYQMYIR